MKNTDPNYKDLEVVDNQYNDRDYIIDVDIPEFNCVVLSFATKTNS